MLFRKVFGSIFVPVVHLGKWLSLGFLTYLSHICLRVCALRGSAGLPWCCRNRDPPGRAPHPSGDSCALAICVRPPGGFDAFWLRYTSRWQFRIFRGSVRKSRCQYRISLERVPSKQICRLLLPGVQACSAFIVTGLRRGQERKDCT